MTQRFIAIGLMSGTSLDGIDVSLIETDGQNHIRPLAFESHPYTPQIREQIRKSFGIQNRHDPLCQTAETLSTQAHINAVKSILKANPSLTPNIIGYHGQTTYHNPAQGITIQLGNGQLMADTLKIPTIYDMRANDVAKGGQGAPLAPLYHRALLPPEKFPAAIINIGGVSNITFIDHNDIIAFDTGTGNALMDDWCLKHIGKSYDENGTLARSHTPNKDLLNSWLQNDFFKRPPPKSLDRDAWNISLENNDPALLSTLLHFTASGIKKSCEHLPRAPQNWYISGGGRRNQALMELLRQILPGNVYDIDILGWDGDAIEAECFAYLAVRSLLKLPLSLPSTTGVNAPTTGGKLATPS